MKKIFILLCVFLFCGYHATWAKNTFKVLQMNLWHGTSKVPGGEQGVIDVLEQIDPDVVFFCEIWNGPDFIRRVNQEMKKRGKTYYGETFDLAIGILSKFRPDSIEKAAIVPGDEGRAMVKLLTTINGKQVAFYSCHLDYRHYECYMPRGYSGTTWEKIEAPVTDEQTVLEANRLAYRDESIKAFVAEARKDIARGRAVILGGDFNEPSHLDWQDNTKDLWDHHGAVIHWDCSMMLQQAGFKDAYRETHPDPVRCPGFTFPAGNKLAEKAKLEKLAWAPEADERDRIDFIYFYPTDGMLLLKKCTLVGPSETVLHGQIVENHSDDSILTPRAVWPSDHKGNLVTFELK